MFTLITVIKFALDTVKVASKSSPAVVGSVWSPIALCVIVFVMVCAFVPESTVAEMVRVALPNSLIVPIFQIPVDDAYEPWLAVALANVKPVGT